MTILTVCPENSWRVFKKINFIWSFLPFWLFRYGCSFSQGRNKNLGDVYCFSEWATGVLSFVCTLSSQGPKKFPYWKWLARYRKYVQKHWQGRKIRQCFTASHHGVNYCFTPMENEEITWRSLELWSTERGSSATQGRIPDRFFGSKGISLGASSCSFPHKNVRKKSENFHS